MGSLDWLMLSVSLESLMPKSITAMVEITEGCSHSVGGGSPLPFSCALGNLSLLDGFLGNLSFSSSLVGDSVALHRFVNCGMNSVAEESSVTMEVPLRSASAKTYVVKMKGSISSTKVSCCGFIVKESSSLRLESFPSGESRYDCIVCQDGRVSFSLDDFISDFMMGPVKLVGTGWEVLVGVTGLGVIGSFGSHLAWNGLFANCKAHDNSAEAILKEDNVFDNLSQWVTVLICKTVEGVLRAVGKLVEVGNNVFHGLKKMWAKKSYDGKAAACNFSLKWWMWIESVDWRVVLHLNTITINGEGLHMMAETLKACCFGYWYASLFVSIGDVTAPDHQRVSGLDKISRDYNVVVVLIMANLFYEGNKYKDAMLSGYLRSRNYFTMLGLVDECYFQVITVMKAICLQWSTRVFPLEIILCWQSRDCADADCSDSCCRIVFSDITHFKVSTSIVMGLAQMNERSKKTCCFLICYRQFHFVDNGSK